MIKTSLPKFVVITSGFVLAGMIAGVAARQQASAAAAQTAANSVALDADDIGGVVNGPNGPEAGVWVIAETSDTPTKFHKIVVTDDQGRFVVPDLPKANYKIWVRGYGLVDSTPVQGTVGQHLALTAVQAPNPRAAAQYYPANYWYSMINVPPANQFPGTGDAGNGIAPEMLNQAQFVSGIKASCNVCHQMGNKATREMPASLGTFDSSFAAWDRRVQVGQDGAGMSRAVSALGRNRALTMFADWSDRIKAGAVPPAPPRPQGIERNIVVTGWDWGFPATFAHDEVSTDKRNPTVNANGMIYGADFGTDHLLMVDPVKNSASAIKLPVRDAAVPSAKPQSMQAPSPYWGDEIYWTDPAHPHNPMVDQQGRVWSTQGIRLRENQPAFCKDKTTAFGKYVTYEQGGAGVSVYDPKTGKVELVDTCFGTHHLQFAEDKDNTLYFSGDQNGIGWLNTRIWDETHDISKAEGWCPLIVDYNGDGKIGAYTLQNEPADPTLDRRIRGGSYSIVPNPVDGTIWFAQPGVPGAIVRLDVGKNPPETCRAEIYQPPFGPGVKTMAYTPRGIDVDRNGVIWTGLASSGHYASFDRRKCSVLNGPKATGQQCPEGWTLYRAPGPAMGGVEHENSADFFYTNFVDQFDTLGLGKNIPIANGTASDSLLVLQPNGQWVIMRVPYPLGFYTRGLDGRIDNPNTGWKGRGIYGDYGPNAVWHMEGGKGTLSEVVKFQVRPNPLAK
jgi:hypothetical protein